ncbi:MAG: urea carboxylase-associated family protein [Ardenticatenaceae bacterium]|nr:urea carboxylase-associated family protein [Ardenticatenaceae bacterium]
MKKIIPATQYDSFLLKAGSYLKIIDIEGGQVADLTAFKAGEVTEWLSNGRSFDYEGTNFFSTGSTLYSNKSRPMLTIVEDIVGRHDFLYTPCSTEMYRLQYGIEGTHPNCLDNLRLALAAAGQEPPEIPTPFNVFMNVELSSEGRLNVQPPLSQRGDHITFRAEMELIVAISACPSINCNGGTQKPIGYEIE